MQELRGRAWPIFGRTDWWPSALISTGLMVAGWAYFINANSMAAIWPMFGVSNQLLAVIALAVITMWLINEGRGRYAWVTVLPMLVVLTTTSTAAVQMLVGQCQGAMTQLGKEPEQRNWTILINSIVQGLLIIAMLTCTFTILIAAGRRVLATLPPAPARAVPEGKEEAEGETYLQD